jgi:hypothetical protein
VSGNAEPLDEASLVALPEDVLEPAGSIQSVMDDVVVVQGLENSRALTEGWVDGVHAHHMQCRTQAHGVLSAHIIEESWKVGQNFPWFFVQI